jgi:hypothetical protein
LSTESQAAAAEGGGGGERLALPFIVVATSAGTEVSCEMSEDQRELFFEFSDAFEIHDDAEVMKRLGLNRVESEAELKSLFAPRFHPFLPSSLVNPALAN